MVRRFFRVSMLATTTGALALLIASCSSEGSGTSTRGSPVGSGGGGQGGAGGSGQGGSGGTAQGGNGGGGAGGAGGGTPCPTGNPCCGGLGACIPESCLDATQNAALAQDLCASGQKCAPASVASGTLPAPCRSVDNSEGRCGSTCIPQIAQQASRLPADTCTGGELCAPCFNPVDGTLTGICNISGDAPQEAAYVFTDCGDGRGKCVPADLVPENRRANVPQDTCLSGRLCAPTEAIMDPNYQFPVCRTTIVIYPDLEGRCVPDYVVRPNPNYGVLNQGDCANAGDKCAPCNDPTNNTPTGACS